MVFLASLKPIQLQLVMELADLYRIASDHSQRAHLVSRLLGEGSPVYRFGSLAGLVQVVPAAASSIVPVPSAVAAGATTYAVGKVAMHYFASTSSLFDADSGTLRAAYAAWYQEGETRAADWLAGNGTRMTSDGFETAQQVPRTEQANGTQRERDGLFQPSEAPLRISLHSFTTRYMIRPPHLGDLAALSQLEAACWAEGIRASDEEIRDRIARFPTGHCVLEIDHQVVGVIYAQRIHHATQLRTATATTVRTLHVPHGPLVQLLALNVLPTMQHLGLGDQLLEFMLLRCAHEMQVNRVVAVTRCKNYPKHADMPAAAYIRARGPQGQLVDPILRFHEYHGAVIQELIAGYRPEDRDNRGAGVLIAYNLPTRRAQQVEPKHRTETFQASILEDSIRSLLGQEVELSPTRSLSDLGLDSLALYGLRMLLNQRLGVELEPTFFFQYSTLEAMTDYFAGKTQPREPLPAPQVSRPAASDQPALPTRPYQLPDDAIAIIGMSCRFSQGANSPDAYWRLLRDGVDAITEVPETRWNIDQFYHPDRTQPGKIATRYGGFLDEVDRFDARFFNMAPREAIHTDPQQRLLLELTWEALEHAGLAPDSLKETPTGVFVGIFSHDYELLQVKRNRAEALDTYFATGNSVSLAAGRIAYVFGFQGPAMAVDTACSSSLVALHLACGSLRHGECNLAIAAGVNLLLSPELSMTFSRAGMLSPDGRCRTFDAAAQGYVRAEGGGVVLLKRLSQAIADRDCILALVRGTAVNQDGTSNGLTAPNGLAQRAVIRRALAEARVHPHDVSYVETHGTATPLGDPVELNALHAVYAQGRAQDHPLIVGSVKTNIGHTEAAAGIAGLIKVVLAMQHRYLPPHLHFNSWNPHGTHDRMLVPKNGMAWQPPNDRYLAGISSFGFSGTNAHVILEQAPPCSEAHAAADGTKRSHDVLTLSAKDAETLQEVAQRYASHLQAQPDLSLAQVCCTTNRGRSHFDHRLAVVVTSVAEAQQHLEAFARHQASVDLMTSRTLGRTKHQLCFLFTGQGSQFPGMGRELYETHPTCQRILNHGDEILRGHTGKSLLQALYPEPGDPSPLHDTAYTQPALFALEYALAELWTSWGIKPDAVLGHSVGEYVAACVAGVFSFEDGMKLIADRGRLMQALPPIGAMVAVFAPEHVVAAAIAPYAAEVSIAALNGPDLTVISGLREAVATVTTGLQERGCKTAPLTVSHAFHSPLMQPILEEFRHLAAQIAYAAPHLPLVSNLSGKVAGNDIQTPDYWVKHIIAPVQFAPAMETLFQKGYDLFVEIGPHPVLSGMGRRLAPNRQPLWLPSLSQGRPDWQQLLRSLGHLYACGLDVDWTRFYEHEAHQRLALPTYPFRRERFWIETGPASTHGSARAFQEPDPLLQRLQASGAFSEAELQLAPKLLRFLANPASRDVAPDGADEVQFQVQWQPLPRVQQGPPDYLPSPEQLQEVRAAGATGQTAPHPLLPELERLSLAYVLEAFRKLGWQWQVGQQVASATLPEQLGVVSQQQRLLRHLLGILAEQGILLQTEDGWQVASIPPVSDPTLQQRLLIEQYPEAEAELTLLGRCGSQVSEVLRGACDAVQLIFPQADVATATRLYQDSPTFAGMNSLMQGVVSRLLRDLPPDRHLNILEIGAGTGGTTSYLLPYLPAAQTNYVFTDVSTLFTEKARQKFRDYPFVQYRLLNIEQAPENQGFGTESYDLIVAANVLHATSDLRQTLANTRHLLAPGGALVLLEGTARRRWIDLIFGLLEGWWRFSDHHLRPSHALLPVARWQDLLAGTGFRGGWAAFPSPEGDTALFPQAIMVARNALPESTTPPPRTQWLIFADRQGVGSRLANRLWARGHTCTLVFPGSHFDRLGQHEFRIGPAQAVDFQRLVQDTSASRWDRIVYLWSLDATATGNVTAEDLEKSVGFGCRSVLHLVQALSAMQRRDAPVIWLVTQGAQHEPAFPEGVAQSALWGLGNVLMREHPEFHCRLVDLDPTQADTSLDLLWAEIEYPEAASEERFLSFRHGQRFGARWVRSPQAVADREPLALRPDGTYLITGGLGGIGLQVCRWLVERGARHLVLVGRHRPSASAEQQLQALRQSGARIEVVHADVSQYDQMARVFRDLEASLPPLRGLMHGAGVFEDRLFMHQDWASFSKVFAPKVRGAWNLHLLTRDCALDFYVLFSSVFAVVGETGLANYAAANAFMDALASYRKTLHLPGLSINWGPWDGVGMAQAVGKRRQAQWRAQGIHPLPTDQALAALEGLMQQDMAQCSVVSLEVSTFVRRFAEGLQRTFLNQLDVSSTQAAPDEQNLRHTLRAASPDAARAILATHVRTLVAGVLGFGPGEPLDLHQGFFHLGMDSLTAMELRNRLQASLMCSIPETHLFKYPTVHTLTEYLAQEILPAPPSLASDDAPASVAVPPSDADIESQEDLLAAMDGTSEEALDASILSELEALENVLRDGDA
jgi:microcystin synthetase protein McyG